MRREVAASGISPTHSELDQLIEESIGVRTLFLNLHVMFCLVSDVEVFCSLLYSFGSFFLPLC